MEEKNRLSTFVSNCDNLITAWESLFNENFVSNCYAAEKSRNDFDEMLTNLLIGVKEHVASTYFTMEIVQIHIKDFHGTASIDSDNTIKELAARRDEFEQEIGKLLNRLPNKYQGRINDLLRDQKRVKEELYRLMLLAQK